MWVVNHSLFMAFPHFKIRYPTKVEKRPAIGDHISQADISMYFYDLT